MSYATELLRRQYLELARNPPDGVSVGLGEDENIFNWDLMIGSEKEENIYLLNYLF